MYYFEGLLQNFRYKVVYANNIPFEFTIENFPLINVNDLVSKALLMGDLKKTDILEKIYLCSWIWGYQDFSRCLFCSSISN